MSTAEFTIRGRPDLKDWQEKVRDGLRGRFHAFARAIFGAPDAEKLVFSLIKYGPRATSLRVSEGETHVFLKLFDKTGEAPAAYVRERSALIALRNSGLVPRLIGFDDEVCFVATEFVDGQPLDDPELKMSPIEQAYRLGEWTASLDCRSPARRASGTWLNYLSKFEDSLAFDVLGDVADILADVPLCGLAMSHGDAALHNFMLDADNQLIACDFEAARMRPRGWDFMMTYLALLTRYPDAGGNVVSAFADGFDHYHRGALITDELIRVARIIYCARALSDTGREEG